MITEDSKSWLLSLNDVIPGELVGLQVILIFTRKFGEGIF